MEQMVSPCFQTIFLFLVTMLESTLVDCKSLSILPVFLKLQLIFSKSINFEQKSSHCIIHNIVIFLRIWINSFNNEFSKLIKELLIQKRLSPLGETSHKGGMNTIPGLYDENILFIKHDPCKLVYMAKHSNVVFLIVYQVPSIANIISSDNIHSWPFIKLFLRLPQTSITIPDMCTVWEIFPAYLKPGLFVFLKKLLGTPIQIAFIIFLKNFA